MHSPLAQAEQAHRRLTGRSPEKHDQSEGLHARNSSRRIRQNSAHHRDVDREDLAHADHRTVGSCVELLLETPSRGKASGDDLGPMGFADHHGHPDRSTDRGSP